MSSYNLISDGLAIGHNKQTPCQCTPKCERDIYRTTLSQAAMSQATLNPNAAYTNPCPYCQSANRLEDYVVMYATNKSWATILYRLSNQYRDSRKLVLDIAEKVAFFRNATNHDDTNRSTERCNFTFLDSITDITTQFSVWETMTFYLNDSTTLYMENFISHMANDIVRGLGNLDGFLTGFTGHLQRVKIVAEKWSTCNETALKVLSRNIVGAAKQANTSFRMYYEEYKLFTEIVKSHQRIKSYKIPVDDSPEGYIRWAMVSIHNAHNSILRVCGYITITSMKTLN